LKKAFVVVFIILVLDQVFKIWIKTTMTLGQEIPVLGDWFLLHFTENEGMAFGLQFGGATGKLLLSIFRIIAAIIIGYYIWHLDRKGSPAGLMISFGLILAGALGNIIDSAFYGLVFSNSGYHTPAVMFPAEGGYSSFLHGRVVDMLYFPLIDANLPDWIPLIGGQNVQFFRPVFNLADASITTGVLSLIIFQKKFFTKSSEPDHPEIETPETEPDLSNQTEGQNEPETGEENLKENKENDLPE
jgi:signal peptidase II